MALCERCKERQILERDGVPVRLNLFGEDVGALCIQCARQAMKRFEAEIRGSLATDAPDLTPAQIDRVVQHYLDLAGLALLKQPNADTEPPG
jgi:hypothetical protein